MRGRTIGLLLVLLLTLGLSGCLEQEQGTVYDVYYRNQAEGEENALAAEKRTLPQDTEPVEGLLQLLLDEPQSEDLEKAIPEGVRVRKWSIHNGLLTVDFSSAYASLSGINLTLADYSVVLTLTQLEEVDTVMITADGEMLAYRDHQRLTAEDAWSVLAPDAG